MHLLSWGRKTAPAGNNFQNSAGTASTVHALVAPQSPRQLHSLANICCRGGTRSLNCSLLENLFTCCGQAQGFFCQCDGRVCSSPCVVLLDSGWSSPWSTRPA